MKEYVQTFLQLQAGERKLLVDALIRSVEIGANKRVILCLRSPFAFGYLSPMLASRGIEPVRRGSFTTKLDFELDPCHGNYRFVWARPWQRLHKQIRLDTHFLPQS